MYKQGSTIARLRTAIVIASAAIVSSALPAAAQYKPLPMEPLHETGQSVTPAFEGWWQNADGSYNLMFGYFNRNTKEIVEVPVGPNNKIEPGPVDQGQPAYFIPRRQWGVFTITVPKNTSPDQKFVWTLVANDISISVPGFIKPAWSITPLSEIGIGNTPPTISFDEKGPANEGPKPIMVERTAIVGTPLELTVYAADDAKTSRPGGPPGAGGRGGRGGGAPPATPPATPPAASAADSAIADAQLAAAAAAAGADPDQIAQFLNRAAITVTWQKFRGPGNVTFGNASPRVVSTPNREFPAKKAFVGEATTSATFSEPGEYILRLVANDSSGPGGGGFLCCWTNGEVRVIVK